MAKDENVDKVDCGQIVIIWNKKIWRNMPVEMKRKRNIDLLPLSYFYIKT